MSIIMIIHNYVCSGMSPDYINFIRYIKSLIQAVYQNTSYIYFTVERDMLNYKSW